MHEPNIFLIGPASVGKTTTGRLLAQKLGRRFVDVDFRFCEQIGLITDYICEFGYEAYCEANSKLVDDLISEYPASTIFATPSGFLVHESSPLLVEKHLGVIGSGLSVLLLPSADPEESADMIVQRQLDRHPHMDAPSQRARSIQ